MAIENNRAESADQGPAARSGDTEDGLYPDTQGDLGHKKGGDTEALPGSNEPLASESGAQKDKSEKGEGGSLRSDQPDNPAKLDSTINEE